MKSARLIHTGYGVWVARARRKRSAAQAAAQAKRDRDFKIFDQIARNDAAMYKLPTRLTVLLWGVCTAAILVGVVMGCAQR